ncbi:MAG: TauD/TfdA family dioxygenase [Myxococcales bacterium]|nr:TauD/TfdA family dioxygenase [Myxococcales bacterium]
MSQSTTPVPDGPPSAPLQSAADWRGPGLAGHRDWIEVLSERDMEEIDAALTRVEASGKPRHELRAADFGFQHFAEVLADWKRELAEGRGFLLVRGLPVERYSEAQCALVYWGIGQHLGTPVSQNADGDLLGHVRDTGDDPDDPNVRLYRTRARQDFHTDGADIIGLLCLQRSKSGGESRIASSIAIFNEILRTRPELAAALFQPFAWDHHGQQRPGARPFWEMPICSLRGGRLNTFFLPWYIRQAQRHSDAPRLTQAQAQAIEAIEQLANDPEFYLEMEFLPGDIQLLKNSVILHARNAYEDHAEPERRRHLLRLWLATDFADGLPETRTGVVAQKK